MLLEMIVILEKCIMLHIDKHILGLYVLKPKYVIIVFKSCVDFINNKKFVK